MSWAATSYVKKLRIAPNGEAITKGEKLVLFVLADYHHEEKGYAWASLSHLADESLHSRHGVILTLQSLEKKGVLCVVRSPEAVTKRVTNRYSFPGLESLPQTRTSEATTPVCADSLNRTGVVTTPDLVKPVDQTSVVTTPGLVKPVDHIFPEDLSSDLSNDSGAGQLPSTGLDSIPKKRSTKPPKGDATYHAYAEGYVKRYRVEPVRNAKTNTLMCQLVDRLGAEEAPSVAAFYLSVDTPLYINARHAPSLLIRDCEGLRTQWKTGVARLPKVGPKAFQPIAKVEKPPEECPPEAARALARILGRPDAFNFPAAPNGGA